jgi:Zn-dependent peptidase ImmA (M78 family)
MPTMKHINEAVRNLKDAIINDGYNETTMIEIAEEWDVNPQALLRKFMESTSKPPEDYKVGSIQIDHKKIYEEGMSRTWKSHPKMKWDDLSAKEQIDAIAFIERHLVKKDKLQIVWK